MNTAAHRGLYDPDEPTPRLFASQCSACQTVSFPAMTIGCEVCGAAADQLINQTITAAGVLHSVAVVHLHTGKDIAAPFAMAEIALDDGPLIRATLSDLVGAEAIGRRVSAGWFRTGIDDSGHDIVEPRFALVAVEVSS